MNAKVSIIIPSYNRAAIISRALESIISQTVSEWECIVVDDHSIDNTNEIVQQFIRRDSRIQYVMNCRTKGAQGARNTGLFLSQAEWVCFFDSDNRMHPEFIEIMMSGYYEEYDVIKCSSNVIDFKTGNLMPVWNPLAEGYVHRDLFNGKTYVDFNQEIIRKNKLLEIGGLDEDCPSLQEFDTNIRLSKIARYRTIQKLLVDYYVGGNDTISANYEKQVKGKLYNLKKYKKEWLEDKKNADRVIYETCQKLKMVKSFSFKLKYAFRLVGTVPEMIPYYLKKKIQRCL